MAADAPSNDTVHTLCLFAMLELEKGRRDQAITGLRAAIREIEQPGSMAHVIHHPEVADAR